MDNYKYKYINNSYDDLYGLCKNPLVLEKQEINCLPDYKWILSETAKEIVVKTNFNK